jgi:hypothetical protein
MSPFDHSWKIEDQAVQCEFRFNPAGDSDLIPATIPI